MKIIMVEANAEEIRANKRVMDTIIDALSEMIDGVVKGDIPISNEDDDEENKDDDWTPEDIGL